MAEYCLTITRREPNPSFNPSSRMNHYEPETPQYVNVRTCEVTLTEAEYQAVKQALVEHWATRTEPQADKGCP